MRRNDYDIAYRLSEAEEYGTDCKDALREALMGQALARLKIFELAYALAAEHPVEELPMYPPLVPKTWLIRPVAISRQA
jgi:hypothetical protein